MFYKEDSCANIRITASLTNPKPQLPLCHPWCYAPKMFRSGIRTIMPAPRSYLILIIAIFSIFYLDHF